MRYLIMIIGIHLCASLAPFADWQSHAHSSEQIFQEWPTEFEGKTLIPMVMSEKEQGFNQGFPGRVGRFTDGSREILIRYIAQPTRKLHPSANCLRAAGYKIEPQPINRDRKGQLWGCVLATQNGKTYKVCERMHDESGNSWYDVSSWFWSVMLKNSQGPWWAVTVAERV